MRDSLRRLVMLAVCVVMASSLVFAQSAASLSGLVVDTGGGVIPGATVVVKNNSTSVETTVVSNSTGAFTVPALPVGVYTVTVSLSGFKTFVITDVRLLASTAAEVKATLAVGALTESVEVRAGSELVQTQSATVQSTLKAEQLKELPLVSRNALYAVAFLPGVETAFGSSGTGPRQSTVSGLPQNTINITIDGISTGNQLQSGDGFFSMVTPRLDAVEEITVTSATSSAVGSQGSVQIAFVTRSGGNSYETSIYHYARRPGFNSNYYFNDVNNLPKNQVIVDNYGGRIGGPIRIPGLYDGRGKAFFFFNFEHFHQPNSATRTRTILNPQAQAGLFTYMVGTTPVNVDLYALAARNGFTSTPDALVGSLLNQIRASTDLTGVVNTPATSTNTQQFVYQATSANDQYAPTTKIDLNLSQKHRLSGSYWWQRFKSNPDLLNSVEPQYPGFPNFATQNSYRTTGAISLRSTLSPNIVNEVKTGWQWSPNEFFTNVTRDMFENQGFWNMGLPNVGQQLSGATASAAPAPRNTTNINFEDTFSWLRGSHSYSFGGGYVKLINRSTASTVVPSLAFAVNTTNDPANAMFTNAANGNFPGASTADLNNARAVYALLTGRLSSIGATGRLDSATGKYVYNGDLEQALESSSYYGFAQDTWKVRPNLTVNVGLRYELFLPVEPITNTYSVSDLQTICGISGLGSGPEGRGCNLFQPGNLSGTGATVGYYPFTQGNSGYKTNYNNFAPNAGVAWQPNVEGGFMRTLLGDPETATFRAGYAWTYNVEKFDRFTGIFGANPGGTAGATRNAANGNLVYSGESWPLLLRETSRLGPPPTCAAAVSAACMPEAPTYPIGITTANSVNIFDEDLKTPHVESWSMGFQRSIDRNTALEVRYVGNRNQDTWTTENWNERVLFENGFMDEFKRAMANLQSHVAAGCGTGTVGTCSFAYRGPGTGTSPLPYYLGYFTGRSDASNAAAYTGGNWINTSYTGDLSPLNTNITSTANDLHADTTFRSNAIAAGLPANFFQMNPNIGAANITRALAGTRYNSLQLEMRRRLSRGLAVQGSYTFARSMGSNLLTLAQPRLYLENTGVPHAFKMDWTYEIPFGRGRRYGSDSNAVMNGIIGGWQFSGTGRFQRQQFNAGSVRLVGMTRDDLQKAFQIRTVTSNTGTVTVFSMEQDIIDNTRKAYNTDPASPTGYSALGVPEGRYIAPGDTPGCVQVYVGDCNTPYRTYVYGPAFVRFDMRFKKNFELTRKVRAELGFELMNIFNNTNFYHQMNPGAAANIFQVTAAYTDLNTTQDPGGRIGQFMWRVTF